MSNSSGKKDVRWIQQLSNLGLAYEQLRQAILLSQERDLSDLEKLGLIHAFEFTHELAWNVMKDYFEFQGGAELITGSRDASREAFKRGLVSDGEIWMEMIQSRNQTSHTYNKTIADEIIKKICFQYFQSLETFFKIMKERSSQ